MEIFFDNTQIDDDLIIGLRYEARTNATNFYLGSTICKCFYLDVDNSIAQTIPDNVYIKSSGYTLAKLYVDEVNRENLDYTSLTLVDYMLLTDFNVIADNTVSYILTNQLGSHWDPTTNLYGLDITVKQEVNIRDLIGYLAELNAGYAYVDSGDVIRITEWKDTNSYRMPIEKCSSFKEGAKHHIDRVYVELAEATHYYPQSSTYDTVYLNPDNYLITDSSGYSIENILMHIQQHIDGFEFYNISVEKMSVWDLGDFPLAGYMINFTLGEGQEQVTYPSIMQCDYTYNGGWSGGLIVDLNTDKQQETSISLGDIVNNVTIKVDRELGIIERTVANTAGDVSQLIQDAQNLTGYFSNVQGTKYIRLSADGIQVSKTPSDDASLNITDDGIYIKDSDQVVVASMKANEFDTTNWVYSETRNGTCLNIFRRAS